MARIQEIDDEDAVELYYAHLLYKHGVTTFEESLLLTMAIDEKYEFPNPFRQLLKLARAYIEGSITDFEFSLPSALKSSA